MTLSTVHIINDESWDTSWIINVAECTWTSMYTSGLSFVALEAGEM